MKCETIEQMQRVALAGAAKMDAQGYSYEANADVAGTYTVYLPKAFVTEGGASSYFVAPEVGTCSCTFCLNHAEFGFDATCKHIEYVKHHEAVVAEGEAIADAKMWEGEAALR